MNRRTVTAAQYEEKNPQATAQFGFAVLNKLFGSYFFKSASSLQIQCEKAGNSLSAILSMKSCKNVAQRV